MPPEPTEGIIKNIKVIAEIPTSTKPKDNNKGNRKNGTQDINNEHKGKPSMKEILTGFKELWECVKAAKELLKEP